ncbi:fructosamine kinase family protein [Aquibacillus koreensis]|uniref:Fructosamine kinase family protein n=1 Tax=Aquibacillus koreensis TaxID=279446 RepID=A0A9X4AJX5_9BACI|nr:fructosamine kinase family protein [Aquibacillus koreensis]MCT2538253.1 fructosamine kinase family protein [Aquibacillus koreensis]MDC3420803.1 fructosamine kinase family protein [Aquibacillus koreensis]
MEAAINHGLIQIDDHSQIKSITNVSGGDINQAFQVITDKRTYFIKGNHGVSSDFFRKEVQGLTLMRETNTVGVPEVFYYDQPTDHEDGVLIMEWVEGVNSPQTLSHLGRDLAHMHLHTSEHYGFHEDTYVGTLTQPNDLYSNWLTYYREKRLVTQFTYAIERGRMPKQRREHMEKLLDRLEKWIEPHPRASLLHGDLWSGNWLAGPDGKGYLIDPSISYGDHAFELAFTELFGGFSTSFYDAYQEVFPLPANYEDVKPLYQLYYLLIHLNIFGETYGGSVDQIVNRYGS